VKLFDKFLDLLVLFLASVLVGYVVFVLFVLFLAVTG